MLDSKKFKKRLEIERKLMQQYFPHFRETDRGWRGYIIGPKDSLYEGHVFEVEIVIDSSFPFRPPKVLWYTPTWHPNIAIGGTPPYEVCNGLIGQGWKPKYHIVDVIRSLEKMLAHPNPFSALNVEAAKQMLEDQERFLRNVEMFLQMAPVVQQK